MKIGDRIKVIKDIHQPLDAVFLNPTTFYNLNNQYLNMGLLYMATVLKNEGYRVKCLGGYQLFETTPNDLRRIFTLSKPGLACFYTISDNIRQVEKLAEKIRIWSPGTVIVAGGPLATSLGPEMLKNPCFDLCVVGEGEIPISAIARWKIKKEGSPGEIPGAIYREQGQIRFNPPSPPIADLDSLPFPDYDLAGGQSYFHLVSGRGCPYNCIFCFQGVHGLKYRYRSVDNLIDEIVFNIEKYNLRYFDIIDDTFVSDHRRVLEFAEKLSRYRKKSGRDFLFFCQGRVDLIDRHPEMLASLKEAGLCRLQIGIESGHPETLKIYKKRISTDQIKRVAKLAFDTGDMTMVGNLILGGPFESEETFKSSLQLAKELISLAPGVIELNAGFMAPYPGTPIATHPEKYGLKTIDDTFLRGLSTSDVHMKSEALSVTDLRNMKARFYREISAHMARELKKVPVRMLINHYRWKWFYGADSMWHAVFLSGKKEMSDYFRYLTSPKFSTLAQIPKNQLTSWIPMRIREFRQYSPDGKSVILPETIGGMKLTDEHEKLVYELSSGKMSIEGMLDEFIGITGIDMNRTQILEKIFIPLFRKLEKKYQIIFFQM